MAIGRRTDDAEEERIMLKKKHKNWKKQYKLFLMKRKNCNIFSKK
jgi:hypothetical protein